MNKERLVAFTDAIVAIAATIMVLELKTPVSNDWAGLRETWPTLIAYIISFIMIYVVWYSHHNLFEKAEVITPRAYLINGVWIFFLTLVPFITGWVGDSPDALLPELFYALDLLLWSAAFHWLDFQIRKDNPGAVRDSSTRALDRGIMYGGYALCIVLSFIYARFSLYLIGVISVIMIIRMFTAKVIIKKKGLTNEELEKTADE